jgi:hypothetical protein
MLFFLLAFVGKEKLHQNRVLAYQEHATQADKSGLALEGKLETWEVLESM